MISILGKEKTSRFLIREFFTNSYVLCTAFRLLQSNHCGLLFIHYRIILEREMIYTVIPALNSFIYLMYFEHSY